MPGGGVCVDPPGAALRLFFEYVGAVDMAMLLKKRLRQRARNFTKLLPSMSAEGALRSKDSRLFVNARDYITQCREQALSRSVGDVAS